MFRHKLTVKYCTVLVWLITRCSSGVWVGRLGCDSGAKVSLRHGQDRARTLSLHGKGCALLPVVQALKPLMLSLLDLAAESRRR
jgi:hypothetical protein